jgi:hypothetical protein
MSLPRDEPLALTQPVTVPEYSTSRAGWAKTGLSNGRGGSPVSARIPKYLSSLGFYPRQYRWSLALCQALAITRDDPGVPHSQYSQRLPLAT